MKLIDEAWAKAVAGEAHPRVLTFVALGGEGKTALVAKWAVGMAEKDWPDCDAAFAWSFYSQGTREQLAASSDLFLAEALKFFGTPAVEGVESGHDKGRRLAKWIGDNRMALILDGLEPLQYTPTSPTAGQLKDEGLRALLKGLAQRNKGLCLVTTRYAIKDLESYAAAAPQKDLAPLSRQSGAPAAGGSRRQRNAAGARAAFPGDEGPRADARSDRFLFARRLWRRHPQARSDRTRGGRRRRKVATHFTRWTPMWLVRKRRRKRRRALAMLRLMGLFDRPADAGCLEALWRAPAIEGLTEPLTALSEAQRNIVLTRLADAKLVTVDREASGALSRSRRIRCCANISPRTCARIAPRRGRSRASAALRASHHDDADKPEPTLDDLQPLYQAVAHGCNAGMHLESCEWFISHRIRRKRNSIVQQAWRPRRRPGGRRLFLRLRPGGGSRPISRRRTKPGYSARLAPVCARWGD